MTAPVGAAPSMLRPGRRALTFPRATLKARIAHGPLGYPLSSTLSSVLSSSFSVLFPGPLSRQTPRRSSQGVRKHLSDPAPISLLFRDLRLFSVSFVSAFEIFFLRPPRFFLPAPFKVHFALFRAVLCVCRASRTDCCFGCVPSRFFTSRCSAICRRDFPDARRETQSAMTNWDMRGAFGEGAMATVPCSGDVCVADKRVALEPCTPYLLPVWQRRSYSPGRCAFRTRASGGATKVLDCLPFGSFWTSFW